MAASIRSSENVRRGYLYVACAALLWAACGSISKFLFNHNVTPYQLVQLRTTLSSLMLIAWFGLRRPSILRIAGRDVLYFVILGAGALAAAQFTYFFAISRIHVAAAILLQYLAPVLIVAYSAVFVRDRLSAATLTAMTGAIFGCYLVVGAYNLDLVAMNYIGILSGLASAVGLAWFSVQGEYGMRRYAPWTVLTYSMLAAAGAWNILYPPLRAFRGPFAPNEWALILLIVTCGTIAPFGLYFHGINLIRATRASITATLEPITAGILAYLFLNEKMSLLQLIGGALVVAAVIFLQLRHEHDDKAPALMRKKAAVY